MEIGVFDEEGVCPESIGEIDEIPLGPRGEHDDGQGAEAVVLANPGEHLEAVDIGEFEVQEDQGGKRESSSAGELSFAAEVVDEVFAGANELDGVLDGSLFKGALHEEDVVLAVFNNEY